MCVHMLGVTRGLGDHELRAQAQHGTVLIKPFLSPQPEVSATQHSAGCY